MLRGDGIICGTTTTGTGTLTLAACPAPPGGIDFDVFARAMGYANSAAVLVSYTIIEYTTSAFLTATKQEKGIGTLTLGSSSGIANCTLSRANIDFTATSLDSTATWNVSPGTGISIGTAANTLVYMAPAVADLLGSLPFTGADNSTLTRDGVGFCQLQTTQQAGNGSVTNQRIYYSVFFNPVRRSITKARARVGATYTGQNNNVYAGLYAINSSGYPGKRLADFGALGTSNQAFASLAYIASAALSSAIILEPGFYIVALHPIWTAGGTGTPGLYAFGTDASIFAQQIFGMRNSIPVNFLVEDSNATAAFADPAATPTDSVVTTTSGIYLVWLGN